MFLVSHGPYIDQRTKHQMPANELVIHPNRVKWFVERLEYCQAPDIVFRELTAAEYRARVLKTMAAVKCAS